MRSAAMLCALVIAISTFASPARAQEAPVPGKEYAKKLFDEGSVLEKKNDFAGALAKYKEVARIAPTPPVRFHEAYCLEMLGKLAGAADVYEDVLRNVKSASQPEIIERATHARLDPLLPRVPKVSVRFASPPPDAEVTLDGAAIAAMLFDGRPFRVEVGTHTVAARAPHRVAFTKTFGAQEGSTTPIEVTLAPEMAAAPAPGPGPSPAESPPADERRDEPPAEAPRKRSIVAPAAVTGGAIVALGAGIAFFAAAGGAQSSAEDACPQKLACGSEQTKVRTLDAFALGGFIAAAGLGALAIVLWTSRGSSAAARLELAPNGASIGGEL